MDNSTKESLKNEFRNQFHLSENELNGIDESLELFISNVSAKINHNALVADQVIRERIEYLHSKGI